jgi:RND family efflux transporter MFP subunit
MSNTIWLRRTVTSVAFVVAVVLALNYLLPRAGHAQPPGGLPHGPMPAVAVVVAHVQRMDVSRLETAVGTVQSLQSDLLRSQIDGVLTRVLAREGQHVKRGQLLAQIDDRAIQAELAQARATRARDAANLRIAQLNLNRDENLLKGEAIARETVDEQRASVEELKATVSADDAAIEAAQVRLSYTRVVSPVTGRVGMRRVDAGNVVHASDAGGLFSVVQVDPISVAFALPQQDLARLQPLLAQPQLAQVQVLDRDAGTLLGTGKLMAFDNQIDSATGTLQLRAVFDNREGKLWQGQFVTVQLTTGVDRAATVVDVRALQQRQSGYYVFRVRNGLAEVVPVTVGYQQGAAAEIRAGVSPGDVVVIDGQSRLVAGSAVRVVSDDGEAGGTGGVEVSP